MTDGRKIGPLGQGLALQAIGVLVAARTWARRFVLWYNHEHRHSGIRYVTPVQRYAGEDAALLAARDALYLQARARHPSRWSGNMRNWRPIGPVALNPERGIGTAASNPIDKQQVAA